VQGLMGSKLTGRRDAFPEPPSAADGLDSCGLLNLCPAGINQAKTVLSAWALKRLPVAAIAV